MHSFSRGVIAVTAAAVVGVVPVVDSSAAASGQPLPDQVVSTVPSVTTPDIADGYPNAIVKIGDKIVVGGTFTTVVDRSTNQSHARTYLLAFDADTGLVDPTFAPWLSGPVSTLLPGPVPGTVYVGGRMNQVNHVSSYSKLVLLNLADGSLVRSFRAPSMNGAVMTMRQVNGRLLVGGTFTTVGGVEHGGLVALDPLTGNRLDYLDINLTENHNYNGTGAQAPVGANVMDVDPTGTIAVVIGNFKFANGLDRDQAVLLDLVEPQAKIRDWHTDHYKPACLRNAFDKWVRDVSFSPDGSFFIIGTTGGPIRDTLCDTVSRWETDATGTSLNPTWVNWSGGDTILSVEVTEAAVYAGGHQRWMNNHAGRDSAGTGAVGRSGLAALDPTSGVPLSWNPGRHPRGYGATVVHATEDGLYVGSDTDYFGNRRYRREKLGFFPIADGAVTPAGVSATLPAEIHFTDVPMAPGTGMPDILYRVNAGGPELSAIDEGPDWLDDLASDSPYRTTGSGRSIYHPIIPQVDESVPATTPLELYGSRRWDDPEPPEMVWSFPVPAGLPVEVRLYLAERTWSHSQPGARVFDIAIDDVVVAESVDVAAEVGYNTAMMRSWPVTSDGMLDIEFIRDSSDPAVYGIEIVLADNESSEPIPGIGKRSYDGTELGPMTPVGGADGTAWGDVRGIFLVDDMLFYGLADGSFWRRTFDGSTFELPEELTPHSDPAWDGVFTGSGTTTYSGVPTDFVTAIPSIRSMYYADGRIFYTRADRNNLYWRWFNPENGLAGSREFTVPGSGLSTSLNNLSDTSGLLFCHGDYVYWVRAADGRLVRRELVDNGPGTEQVSTSIWATRGLSWGPDPAEAVSGPDLDGIDWRTPGAFLRTIDG